LEEECLQFWLLNAFYLQFETEFLELILHLSLKDADHYLFRGFFFFFVVFVVVFGFFVLVFLLGWVVVGGLV
jgi:hypothetical protein